jgi:hypothetical protein
LREEGDLAINDLKGSALPVDVTPRSLRLESAE